MNTRMKELKNICFMVSLVWVVSLAFAAQYSIPDKILADTYSIILMLSAALQVIGNKLNREIKNENRKQQRSNKRKAYRRAGIQPRIPG